MDPHCPDDGRSDAELLAALRAGDARAAGVLYERHGAWAMRVAQRFARDADEAGDAVQEAFMWVIRACPVLHPGTAFATLLYPAVKNAALTLRRRSKRLKFGEPARDDAAAPEASVLPETGVDDALARAIAALPEEQREVLLLRAVDGLALEHIGLTLGVPVGTVKSRLHHAVRAVRERMERAE